METREGMRDDRLKKDKCRKQNEGGEEKGEDGKKERVERAKS